MGVHSVRTNIDASAWQGDIPCTFTYTVGLAGERFLRALKDEGKILGAHCAACGITQLPPRIFCGKCFRRLGDDAWREMPLDGAEIWAYTICRRSLDGEPLKPPRAVGIATWPGVAGGLLVNIRPADPRRLSVGLRGRIALKPAPERTGSITDIDALECL